MPLYKGVGLLFLKKMFSERSADEEAAFLGALSEEDKKLYEFLVPQDWVPIDKAAELFEKAVQVLFPDDPDGLVLIGKKVAKDNLTGIYRLLFRITTLPFAVKMTRLIWGRYFDTGKPTGNHIPQENTTELVVKSFPDLPEAVRMLITGYLIGLTELCNQEIIEMNLDDSNPNAWRWRFSHKARTLS